jgi:hypothetical protein
MARRGVGSEKLVAGHGVVDGGPGDGWPADGVPVVALTATSPSMEQAMIASGSRRCQSVTGGGSSVLRWLACSHHDEAGARPVRATGVAAAEAGAPLDRPGIRGLRHVVRLVLVAEDVLARTLDEFTMPAHEKDQVLGAFAAHRAVDPQQRAFEMARIETCMRPRVVLG